LTLQQAIDEAFASNAGIRVVRQSVDQAERRSRVSFSYYLPRVSTQAAYLGTDNTRGIIVPTGSLGTIPGFGSFPPASTSIPQGGSDIAFALTTVQQPLTQFFKIREGLGVSRADVSISQATLRRTEGAVAIGVLKAYAGLLIASKEREVARAKVTTASLRSATQMTAVKSGLSTDVVAAQARLKALQARQEVLEADGQYADLSYALADAIGLPGSTQLAIAAPPDDADPLDSLDVYLDVALRSNPDVLEAAALLDKATHGVAAAKASYIPDVGLFGGHFYQSSFPFLPHNTFVFGAIGTVTLLDFGARRNTLAERNSQKTAAELNLARVKSKVRGDVEAAYRKVARAREMASIAHEAYALSGEALRLRVVQQAAGYAVPADESAATADQLDADLNVLKAEMGYRIARAELDQLAGRLVP
jgi:outer membrane protein TolC